MIGSALLLAFLGAVAVVAGLALFVLKLVGAWRGRNSANLEYGVMPAMVIAVGLIMIERGAGWLGWPAWAYFVVPTVLAVGFCVAILRAGKRGQTDV